MSKLKAIIALLFAKEWIVFADDKCGTGCSFRYLKNTTRDFQAAWGEFEARQAFKQAKHIINSKPNLN
jgi:uncharacterized ferritin-like protein (DUF455 family)